MVKNTYNVFKNYLKNFDRYFGATDIGKFVSEKRLLSDYGRCIGWSTKDIGRTIEMWIDILDKDEYHGTRFNKFIILSFILKCSPLSVEQQFDIIMSFIKYNISAASPYVLDIEALYSHKFKSLTLEEALNYLNSGLAYKFNYNASSILTLEQQQKLSELKSYLMEVSCDDQKNDVYYDSIKKHCLDHKGKITKSDINAIIDAFKNLGVLDSVVESIKDWFIDISFEYNLLRKINGTVNEVPKSKTNNTTEGETQPKYLRSDKHYLTDAEYNKVKKQLVEYIDFYSMTPKVELTLSDLLKCIDMLVILDYSDSDIIAFVNRELPGCDKTDIHYDREDFDKLDGLSLYEKYKDLINFYKDNPSASIFINHLLMYVSELETLDDNELIELYKEEIKGILKEVLAVLPNDCRYEINIVKKNLVSIGEKYYG